MSPIWQACKLSNKLVKAMKVTVNQNTKQIEKKKTQKDKQERIKKHEKPESHFAFSFTVLMDAMRITQILVHPASGAL